MTTEFNAIVTPVYKISRDMMKGLRQQGGGVTDSEARFLVDLFYSMQRQRIRTNNQEKGLDRDARKAGNEPEPHEALSWTLNQFDTLEDQIEKILKTYVEGHPMSWFFSQTLGIGTGILAAGLLAHIDIRKAPTAGHIWAYAGLDPNRTWEKKTKRPWNAQLKTLCVLPDCRITTKRGHIKIKDVVVGDEVLTHKGRWKRVKAVFQNEYSGAVHGLRGANSGNQVAWLTSGHPVYCSPRDTWTGDGWVKVKPGISNEWGWNAVETIEQSWLISRPVICERSNIIPDIEFSGVSDGNGNVAAQGRWTGVAAPKANKIPKKIALTPDLMRLIGLYLAEGHVSGNYIGWSFHICETDLSAFVVGTLRDIFTIDAVSSVNKENNSMQVIAGCKPLAETFAELFGCNGDTMIPPMDWLSLPDDLLLPMWEGIMAGDGDHVGKFKNKRISTSNPLLARFIVDLGRRIGFSVSLHTEKNLKAYRIHINVRKDTDVSALKTVTSHYDGIVHNIEVEEDHSYVVEGYAVHNCWKIGDSFVKTSNHPNGYYGRIYRERKAYEWARNIAGGNVEQAAVELSKKRFKDETDAKTWLSGQCDPAKARAALDEGTAPTAKACAADGEGVPMLPPAQIDARARRYAVKMFLSHLQEQWWRVETGEEPPKPWAISIGGHAHYIAPPQQRPAI